MKISFLRDKLTEALHTYGDVEVVVKGGPISGWREPQAVIVPNVRDDQDEIAEIHIGKCC